MNIVGFPDDQLELEVLHAILAGGAERVLKVGAVIVGGHTVRDAEIKYGLSVTGVVEPAQLAYQCAGTTGRHVGIDQSTRDWFCDDGCQGAEVSRRCFGHDYREYGAIE